MLGVPQSHLAIKTRLRGPTNRKYRRISAYFCGSFLLLIKHKDNFISHYVVAVVDAAVAGDDDDADDAVVLFFFYDTSAQFWAMDSPLPAFRTTEFLRGEYFSNHAQPQTWKTSYFISFFYTPNISPCIEVTKLDTNIRFPLLISRHICETSV